MGQFTVSRSTETPLRDITPFVVALLPRTNERSLERRTVKDGH